MNIGRAIYALRKEKGLKLEDVALDADTDSGHLSRIETGRRKPSLPMLEKIAASMGVSVSLIVAMAEGEDVSQWAARGAARGVATGEADLSEDSIQLRQLFRELKPKNQKVAVELLRVLNRSQAENKQALFRRRMGMEFANTENDRIANPSVLC